jgi:small-conductance mechanosensitive channel
MSPRDLRVNRKGPDAALMLAQKGDGPSFLVSDGTPEVTLHFLAAVIAPLGDALRECSPPPTRYQKMDWGMNLRDVATAVRDLAGQRLFDIGGASVTVGSLVTFVLIMLVFWWTSIVLRRVTERGLQKSGIAEPGTKAAISRLIHYLILLVGLGVALQTVGINLASLFAAGAVVAVAVGFAMQNILQNFASGVILLVERSIREGDVLEVDGDIISVERIGTRSTVARTRNDEQLIIPNSNLVQSTVKNFTLADRFYRVRCRVGVAYNSDQRRVEEVLLSAAEAIEERYQEREPVVLLAEFADSSVVWEVSIWAEDPWGARATRSSLNKAIWWALKDNGITIAYPQLDVHFDPQASPAHGPEA